MENQVLIVYGSQYGATKRYAEVLAKQFSAAAQDVCSLKEEMIDHASLVIYGGGVYAGKLCGSDKFKKQAEALLKKPLIVFSCGSANPALVENKDALVEDIKKSLGEALWQHAHCFHLRGDLQYSKMNFVHRMMMKMMISMLKKQKEPNEEAKEMIRTYGQDVHFFDPTAITGIKNCAEQLLGETDESKK